MDGIQVSKEQLLATLREQREQHMAIFEQAQIAYREKVIQVLDQRLQEAISGRPVTMLFNLPEPVNYTEEFDKAIAMIEWEQRDIIELSERDFQRFVLNKWEWANQFAASTRSYIG